MQQNFSFPLRTAGRAGLTNLLNSRPIGISCERLRRVEKRCLKHGLERDIIKAQLSTGKAREIYPRLYGKLVRYHGAVRGLIGARFAPTYEDLDASEFAELLRRKKLPNRERERILKAIEKDKATGIKEMEKLFRRCTAWDGSHRA